MNSVKSTSTVKQKAKGLLCPALLAMTLALPVAAQDAPIDPVARSAQARIQNPAEGLEAAARTSQTGVGEVGQRQTRQDSAPGQEPLGRIENRIQNRLQNRLQNRIDRNYDPKARTTSPLTAADAQLRKTTASRPRR